MRLTFVNSTFIRYHSIIVGSFFTPQHYHNIVEEGMEMTQNRIRIVDVADALGLSTATVSKVIHGKTEIVLPVDLIKRESTRKL